MPLMTEWVTKSRAVTAAHTFFILKVLWAGKRRRRRQGTEWQSCLGGYVTRWTL